MKVGRRSSGHQRRVRVPRRLGRRLACGSSPAAASTRSITVTTDLSPGFVNANKPLGQVQAHNRGEDALGLSDRCKVGGDLGLDLLSPSTWECLHSSKSATCPLRALTSATASPPSSMSALTGSSMA